ncbi:hypothetical protein I6A84_21380 [Frankia sp. CNm7]|uniref:hypothetical protein n=1 Tax=Frankia nepalensis TaxID=1836974 RepID=UPI00193472BE|nr:hypothetical protein [Frankia nepalensis]MBL7520569.1 hypothetical protein [Frankia nepalensis]
MAVALAIRYATPLAEADDIVTALTAMTTSQQQPALHYWNTHPETLSWQPEKTSDLHFAVAETMRPAFEAVIADHVEAGAPVVFEGDYLLPELAVPFGDAVRAVVLEDRDEQRIAANYRTREPDSGDQHERARVSVLVGTQLVRRASRLGIPVVAAHPWTDTLDRVDGALRHPRLNTSGRVGTRLSPYGSDGHHSR